jgi:hypothetical protein
LRAQAERLERFQQALIELRREHEQLESDVRRHFEALARFKASPTPLPDAAATEVAASQLGDADEKIQKEARRFAKLLVSEIELYNKAMVAEGRKSRDLYRRMKLDIDRSRQAFEQRFGRAVSKQFDYFHDELVRTLAGNDPTLLGSDYPGPSA